MSDKSHPITFSSRGSRVSRRYRAVNAAEERMIKAIQWAQVDQHFPPPKKEKKA